MSSGESDECGCAECGGDVGQRVRVCDGSGTLPQVCYVEKRHEHCVCGMPMAVGAICCVWCVRDKDLSYRRLTMELMGRVVGGTLRSAWDSGHRVRRDRRA